MSDGNGIRKLEFVKQMKNMNSIDLGIFNSLIDKFYRYKLTMF